ncbi:hypothetical protein SSP531S_12320 [Streptomyces spongiicola]|uniref:Uncharacterized protein n=1 Tax=Streptomyces spongiicola TaxID=1690221 RepID=A0A388SUQ3_9ACTN|nr:hypothetical protein SSP531S_12320 [Streptomyces spongiicola]
MAPPAVTGLRRPAYARLPSPRSNGGVSSEGFVRAPGTARGPSGGEADLLPAGDAPFRAGAPVCRRGGRARWACAGACEKAGLCPEAWTGPGR